MNPRLNQPGYLRFAAISIAMVLAGSRASLAADPYTPFDGEKTSWHDGFDRFDFAMDEETLVIAPFKAPAGEGFGVKDPAKGQRRCIVIVPQQAAAGNPWSWRGWSLGHQPPAESGLVHPSFDGAHLA